MASPGPLFSTKIENVIASPMAPEVGLTVFVISISACSKVIEALSSSSSLWSPSSLFTSLSGSAWSLVVISAALKY